MVKLSRVYKVFGELRILKRNPWFWNKEAREDLASIGKFPKTDFILARPPPWFGAKYDKMSDAQKEVCSRFSREAVASTGMKRKQRLQYLHEKLHVGRKERQPKRKPPGTRFHELYPIPAKTPPTPAKAE